MDPILIRHIREPNSFTLDFYLAHEGYDGLRAALAVAGRPTRTRMGGKGSLESLELCRGGVLRHIAMERGEGPILDVGHEPVLDRVEPAIVDVWR